MSAPRNHGDELIENRAEDQRARDQPHRPVPTPTLPFLTSRPVQPATNNDGVSRAIDRLIDTQEQLTTAIERQVADTAGLISAFRDMMTIASQNAVINNHIHHRNSQLIETSRRETFVHNVNRQLRDDNLQRCQQGRTLHPLYDFATAMPIFDFPAMADDARQLPQHEVRRILFALRRSPEGDLEQQMDLLLLSIGVA